MDIYALLQSAAFSSGLFLGWFFHGRKIKQDLIHKQINSPAILRGFYCPYTHA